MAQIRTVRTAESVRELVREWRTAGDTVAFVPTMGNLHDGHLSLAALAREACDRVLASIFVNPTQFSPSEDLDAYPRTFDDDLARIDAAGTIAAVFAPEVREIYPFGVDDAVRVTLPTLSRELCGASRPGHFDGVASVVCRLLNIAAPDVLVLGQKDYQQFVLMERMIADLRLPVRLIRGPTRREPDGLAMSSRNRYLTGEERSRAPALHAALATAASALRAQTASDTEIAATAVRSLAAAGFRPDYVEVRLASDLAKPGSDARPDELVVLGAAWLGRARLIDNVLVQEAG